MHLDFSDVFLMLRLGLWVSGGRARELKTIIITSYEGHRHIMIAHFHY